MALCERTIGCLSKLGHIAVDDAEEQERRRSKLGRMAAAAGDEHERFFRSLRSRGAMLRC
jgi:hypothetical protein